MIQKILHNFHWKISPPVVVESGSIQKTRVVCRNMRNVEDDDEEQKLEIVSRQSRAVQSLRALGWSWWCALVDGRVEIKKTEKKRLVFGLVFCQTRMSRL